MASLVNPTELEIICDASFSKGKKRIEGEAKSSMVSGGVSLTWKNLSVTVPDKRTGSRSILEGVTGYARPGEMLAIMGPSGSGKSTLLDALAGRLESNTRQSGEILVNGVQKALAYGTSAYVTQEDTLITTLTVGEIVYYSAQLQLPNSLSKIEKKERAESTIREMGLQDATNTRIGGWGIKGVSSGQKRRVSICIEILTRPKLLFLDEPTSGLDSAASYYVMSRIARLDQHKERTIIASIHQPSSEIFGLFHNLCLLSSGKTVYFGTVTHVNEFFASNRFPCPTFKNPSDHLLKTINKDFDENIEQDITGWIPTEEVISILTDSYKSSTYYQEVNQIVVQIYNKGCGTEEKNIRNNASFFTQCHVLTRRSFVNMNRDLGYYWLRVVMYMALSISLGTIFYHIGSSYGSIKTRSMMLMFVATFLTFMTIGGFPSFLEDMKVFERERLNGHYATSAFVIANSLSSIPYLFLISVIPGAIAYYLAGLHGGFNHFVYYASLLYACMILVESLMMIVASLVPNYLMGIIMGASLQGFLMLAGGFFRLPNDLPHPLWRYPMSYVSFHKYVYQGLFKNEFEGQRYIYNDDGVRKIIDGKNILSEKWQVELGYSKWINLVILLGMTVISRVIFFVIIKFIEKIKPALRGRIFAVSKKQKQPVTVNPLDTPSHS